MGSQDEVQGKSPSSMSLIESIVWENYRLLKPLVGRNICLFFFCLSEYANASVDGEVICLVK